MEPLKPIPQCMSQMSFLLWVRALMIGLPTIWTNFVPMQRLSILTWTPPQSRKISLLIFRLWVPVPRYSMRCSVSLMNWTANQTLRRSTTGGRRLINGVLTRVSIRRAVMSPVAAIPSSLRMLLRHFIKKLRVMPLSPLT